MRRVCVVVEAGDRPGRNPLVPPLREELAASGVDLVAWDPTVGFPLPPHPPDADLYLLKGDHPLVLSAGGCLADVGAPCLNPFEATAAAADKARTHARLARAGLPVPDTWAVADAGHRPGPVDTWAARFVKPVWGAHGQDVTLVADGEGAPSGAGPWLVQAPVEGDGYDMKIYGVGDRTAVRRVRTAPGVVDMPREPVADADPSLARLAVAAAEACGLVCFGADFVLGPAGPVLVDLNAFPGYRGVAEGPVWVASAVLRNLRDGR
ncbi:MAG: hypothetical protein M3203_09955 [Actinomycetota bacterium]|nr:hypothetical protein [Actinomycetota bacterium]